MTDRLTAKQEAFCRAYIENGGNASDAYRTAYDAKGMKDATVHREAKALIDNPKVATRITTLRGAAAERHEVTVDSLMAELEEARESAMKNPRGISAAVSAIMGKAKLLGLVVDKNEHTGKAGKPVEVVHTLDEEGIALIKRFLGEGDDE